MWFLFLFVCFIRISSSVTKCLFCKASFQNKIGYFVILYCSPSQNHNSLQDVLKKFEKHPDTSIQRRDFTVIVGDFNVTVWWHIIKWGLPTSKHWLHIIILIKLSKNQLIYWRALSLTLISLLLTNQI